MGKKFESDIKPKLQVNPEIIKPAPPRIEVDRNELIDGPIKLGLSGMKWTLKGYFNQLLGNNNEAKSFDMSSAGVSQSYHRINDLEIVVTSPLTPSQDKESKEFELIGSADMYPGLIAIEGDVFIGEHTDGGDYLLTVTSTSKLSDSLSSARAIEFKVISILSEDQEKALESKTVKESYWIKDRMINNLNPILTESQYGDYLEVVELLETIPCSYIDEFYDLNYDYLKVPELVPEIIDPAITNFVLEVFGVDYDHRYLKLMETPRRELEPSILDSLIDRNPSLGIRTNLSYYNSTLRGTREDSDSRLRSLSFHKHPYFAMASATKHDDVNPTRDSFAEPLVRLFEANTGSYNSVDVNPDGTHVIPFDYESKYYLFTEELYTSSSQISTFEKYVLKVIKGEEIEPAVALALYSDISKLDSLSRFYYLPIIYLMLTTSLERENE